jgi:hypothetical protein
VRATVVGHTCGSESPQALRLRVGNLLNPWHPPKSGAKGSGIKLVPPVGHGFKTPSAIQPEEVIAHGKSLISWRSDVDFKCRMHCQWHCLAAFAHWHCSWRRLTSAVRLGSNARAITVERSSLDDELTRDTRRRAGISHTEGADSEVRHHWWHGADARRRRCYSIRQRPLTTRAMPGFLEHNHYYHPLAAHAELSRDAPVVLMGCGN